MQSWSLLIGRLWQLQMVQGEEYRLLSDRNRFREVDVTAPRGVIYDRDGEILARNEPSFSGDGRPRRLARGHGGDSDEDPAGAVLDRLMALLEILNRPRRRSVRRRPRRRREPTATSAAEKDPAQKADPESLFAIQEREPWVMPRDEIDSQDRRR